MKLQPTRLRRLETEVTIHFYCNNLLQICCYYSIPIITFTPAIIFLGSLAGASLSKRTREQGRER